jgi:hypothetical protein
MKTFQLALGAAALVFGSYVQAGVLYPNKTIDISFDGYCDGMRLVINHSTGLVSGNATGCRSEPVSGVAGGLSKNGAGVAVLSQTFLWTIDDNGKNWVIYSDAGVVINSGTYSVGVPVFVQGQSMSRSAASGQ